ncbi:hypothetical protein ANOM_001292 [Aspergillus nomiae NRRL 13137]|uniref:Major facilitator superfamily (MFS) profile domain-containing protein n=1 Tax=Aspergillus nomiae NRRL (strain ATCC 15546 / NRRL 13137 / CBS 260.88 / M93) TaxID=1509407 RepID=A0A0L1JGS4_ASPN3|nr:uncharacterized protein ANOM_001292 [Aspergillus nomiae NRRL 13137]KNG90598.1 hypothetical protein ANOM_001292 [Aspergillus nomiae NRRL 13137]
MIVSQTENVGLETTHQQPHIVAAVGEDEDYLKWKPAREELLILACLAIVSLVVALDATILVPVLPTIASDLHGDTNESFWVGTAYLLSCAVFQPLFVALSTVFGRQSILFLSLVLFTAGTLICCLSHGMTQLLVGRTVQGVGGAGILCLTFVITTDIIPLRHARHTRPLSRWHLCTWRWVFYLNFPFMGVGLIMVPWVVNLRRPRQDGLTQQLRSIDWVGALLFIASVSSFLIGITWGGGQFPWSSWRTLLPIFLGVAGVIVTVFWLWKGARKPFLRLSLFRDVSSGMIYLCAVLQGLLMFCELYSLPLYLEGPKDMSPTMTGVALMTITGSLMPASVLAGIIITKFGHIRWAIWMGWVIITMSTGLLILLDNDTKTYAWVLIFLSVGLGHGCIIVSSSICVQALAEARDSAQAASMYTFLRSCGMCLGVAVGTSVVQNQLRHQLQIRHLPVEIAENAQIFIASLKNAKPSYSASFIYAVNSAYVHSLKTLFEVLVAVAGVGLIAALFLKPVNMNKRLDTQHGLQQRDRLDSGVQKRITVDERNVPRPDQTYSTSV